MKQIKQDKAHKIWWKRQKEQELKQNDLESERVSQQAALCKGKCNYSSTSKNEGGIFLFCLFVSDQTCLQWDYRQSLEAKPTEWCLTKTCPTDFFSNGFKLNKLHSTVDVKPDFCSSYPAISP